MSPFASVSAALHSIMPAPVASRSFFTCSAEIAIVAMPCLNQMTNAECRMPELMPVALGMLYATTPAPCASRRLSQDELALELNGSRRHGLFTRRRTGRAGAAPAFVG